MPVFFCSCLCHQPQTRSRPPFKNTERSCQNPRMRKMLLLPRKKANFEQASIFPPKMGEKVDYRPFRSFSRKKGGAEEEEKIQYFIIRTRACFYFPQKLGSTSLLMQINVCISTYSSTMVRCYYRSPFWTANIQVL